MNNNIIFVYILSCFLILFIFWTYSKINLTPILNIMIGFLFILLGFKDENTFLMIFLIIIGFTMISYYIYSFKKKDSSISNPASW